MSTTGSIHLEVIPDDVFAEIEWVYHLIRNLEMKDKMKGIVVSVNLSDADADAQLQRMMDYDTEKLVKGVRWILDYAGKYNGNENATHFATTRVHPDGADLLRDPTYNVGFERGFALLGQHSLSFDLQCAPEQLLAAAKLCAKYPNVPVCIDHLGKPRMILGAADLSNENTMPDEGALKVWRAGLRAMAKLPQVYIKISLLGWGVPGWSVKPEREEVLRGLVREVLDMFGVERCMVASNWHTSAAISDSDGLSGVGPSACDLVSKIASWFQDYREDDLSLLFAGNAKKFYHVDDTAN